MTKNRFKDFGAGNSATAEPISFKLYDEEFEARPQIQGKVLINLVKKSRSDDPAIAADLVVEFFEHALTPESLVRFNALLDDPDRVVDVETLGEITGWLVEEYTNRPESLRES